MSPLWWLALPVSLLAGWYIWLAIREWTNNYDDDQRDQR